MKMFRKSKQIKAQSMLEFAFILPFLVVFLLAIAEFFMIISTKIVLNEAVSEACRYLSLNGIYNDHSLDTVVSNMIRNYSPNTLNRNDFNSISVNFTTDSSGTKMVQITAVYTYRLVFPLFQIFALLPGTSDVQLFRTGTFTMTSSFSYPMLERGTVTCPNCGRNNPAGNKYCEYCGTTL